MFGDPFKIAKITGKTESTVIQYGSEVGFSFSNNNERIHNAIKIQYAIDSGALNIQEINEITDLAESTIKSYGSIVSLPKKTNKNRIYSMKKIQKAIDSGAESIREIQEMTLFKKQRIRYYKDVLDLPPKVRKETEKIPERDVLILEGRSLRHMGERLEIGYEGIRQYIKNTGQYDIWFEAKKNLKLRNQSSQK